MKPVHIHKAKAELSRLVERACAAEEVVIARGKRPMVCLVPVHRPQPQRTFGALLAIMALPAIALLGLSGCKSERHYWVDVPYCE